MWESFFGFKKTPFSDSPDAKQLFASQAWNQVKTRLEFLAQHHGVGLITGEVGAGKSTAARVFTTSLNPSLYKILYIHFTTGSALDLLRQIALALDLEPAHFRGDLVRQIAGAIVLSLIHISHSPARCSSIWNSSPTLTSIDPRIVRSVRPNVHLLRTAITPAPSSTPLSMD